MSAFIRGWRRPEPAGQGADAGHQFGEVERHGQVVISAKIQSFDPVLVAEAVSIKIPLPTVARVVGIAGAPARSGGRS